MLHFKDGILTEVYKAFQLLFVSSLIDHTVEKGSFGFLDLRFLPLVNMGLFDLKVDPFYFVATAHDFNSSQVRPEIVQNTTGLLKEPFKSKIYLK